jgi:hypothetical protein
MELAAGIAKEESFPEVAPGSCRGKRAKHVSERRIGCIDRRRREEYRILRCHPERFPTCKNCRFIKTGVEQMMFATVSPVVRLVRKVLFVSCGGKQESRNSLNIACGTAGISCHVEGVAVLRTTPHTAHSTSAEMRGS